MMGRKPPPRPRPSAQVDARAFKETKPWARRAGLARLAAIDRAYWLGLWLVLKANRLMALAEYHLHVPHWLFRAPRRWNNAWTHWFVRRWLAAGRRHRFAKASGIVGFDLAREAICSWPEDETVETERPDE